MGRIFTILVVDDNEVIRQTWIAGEPEYEGAHEVAVTRVLRVAPRLNSSLFVRLFLCHSIR